MPSSKEIKADVIARVLAERFDAVTLRHADDPVDVSRIHREMADDVLTALSAAEKEREGDIIEKLREWAKEGGNAPEISNHVADYTAGWGDGYALALADLGDFLDDPQGQGDDLFWRSYRNGRYVALEELREWERRQREAWEASHSSGADGVRTGTALGVLDRLSCFLNDLQKQSTPKEEA